LEQIPIEFFSVRFSASSLVKKTRRRDSNSAELFCQNFKECQFHLIDCHGRTRCLRQHPETATPPISRRRHGGATETEAQTVAPPSIKQLEAPALLSWQCSCHMVKNHIAPVSNNASSVAGDARKTCSCRECNDRSLHSCHGEERGIHQKTNAKDNNKKKWLLSALIKLETTNHRETRSHRRPHLPPRPRAVASLAATSFLRLRKEC
jgi:hypothetical protein